MERSADTATAKRPAGRSALKNGRKTRSPEQSSELSITHISNPGSPIDWGPHKNDQNRTPSGTDPPNLGAAGPWVPESQGHWVRPDKPGRAGRGGGQETYSSSHSPVTFYGALQARSDLQNHI